MVKYNKIDDGAKEAILKVLKKKTKLSGGSGEDLDKLKDSLFLLNELASQYGDDELLQQTNEVIEQLRKNKNRFYRKTSKLFYDFRALYGNDPYYVFTALGYFFPHISDNTQEGYQERILFVQKVQKLKLDTNPNNIIDNLDSKRFNRYYDYKTKELGFIQERKFYDEFFRLPNEPDYIYDIFNPKNHFDEGDFKLHNRVIELKGRQSEQYKAVRYFIDKSKLNELKSRTNDNFSLVWSEYTNNDALLSSRGNINVKYFYFNFDNELFNLLEDNGLIKTFDVDPNKPRYYFTPDAVRELTDSSQLYDTQSFINEFRYLRDDEREEELQNEINKQEDLIESKLPSSKVKKVKKSKKSNV